MNLILARQPHPVEAQRTEICEHKGVGHPDSICDGVAEAVSQGLCAAYLQAYGVIRHHNVDKALLIAGQSCPKFGGGALAAPVRLVIAGRADPLPEPMTVAAVARAAALGYLARSLHCPPNIFELEIATHTGAPGLRRSISTPGSPLANDTSFGTGFAPYSRLERMVLDLADLLGSRAFRAHFPAAGDDFKVMGRRVDDFMGATIALALVDRFVDSAERYFAQKAAMETWLAEHLAGPCEVRINAFDMHGAADESQLYLTATGLSAEHGDDGQVGRGNRTSRLITPSRPMSLEAAAGKNPVSHVGKLYNVLAPAIADDLATTYPQLAEVNVQLLSAIGSPVDQPQLVSITYAVRNEESATLDELAVTRCVRAHLDRLPNIAALLARGELPVF